MYFSYHTTDRLGCKKTACVMTHISSRLLSMYRVIHRCAIMHVVNYLKMYALDLQKTHIFSNFAFAVFKKCKQDDNAILITYCLLHVFEPHVFK